MFGCKKLNLRCKVNDKFQKECIPVLYSSANFDETAILMLLLLGGGSGSFKANKCKDKLDTSPLKSKRPVHTGNHDH